MINQDELIADVKLAILQDERNAPTSIHNFLSDPVVIKVFNKFAELTLKRASLSANEHGDWIKQDSLDILTAPSGLTVLIKFVSTMHGITADDDTTIDISWGRNCGKIIATTGEYNPDEISYWKAIANKKGVE